MSSLHVELLEDTKLLLHLVGSRNCLSKPRGHMAQVCELVNGDRIKTGTHRDDLCTCVMID